MSPGPILVSTDRETRARVEAVREKLKLRAIELSAATIEQVLDVNDAYVTRWLDRHGG